MKTRSQSKILETVIDFDQASKYWNSNKKKLNNGCYQYVCGEQLNNGSFCKKNSSNSGKCHLHKNKF